MSIYHRVLGCAFILGTFSQLTAAEPPEISLSVTNNSLLLSWPSTSTDWVLEETDLLQPPIPWKLAHPAASSDETMNALPDVQIMPGGRFFRLRSATRTLPRATGEWRLDEGQGDLALNELVEEGTFFTTNTEWSVGRVGTGALLFNGRAPGLDSSRAWVNNENYSVLPAPGEPFSLSFWFNPESLPLGTSGLAGNDPTGSNGWHLVLHTVGAGTNFLEFASGAQGISARCLLLPGQWYSLAISYDGTKGAIYLNGEQVAVGNFVLKTHDGPIYFGGAIAGYSSFHGRIDQLRTYTYCLSPEQVTLAGLWSFDEGTGDKAADQSLNANHGQLSPNGWVPGKSGSGLNLSAADLQVPNDDYNVVPPTGNPFSLSFWLRPQTLQLGSNGIMSFGLEGTNGWEMTLDVNEERSASLRFCSTNRAGTLDLWVPLDWGTDDWMKIDLTHNGGIATAYINGRQVRSAHGAVRSSRAPLVVGHVPGTPDIAGIIDDLKIYHRVREPAEIGPVAVTMWEMAFVGRSTSLVLQGSGPSGKPLTFSLLPSPSPSRGIVALDPVTGILTYTAGPAKGPDVFAYTVSDGEFTSSPSTVTVSVVEPHWLSVTGGEGEPRDGSSAEKAWAVPTADVLDGIWKTNNYYDCFFYGPGTYQTRGWKYQERSTANVGCKHIGSGNSDHNATTLQLIDIWAARTEELIFGPGSYAAPCDGFEVHNLILDCNANNLPKFNQGEPVWIRVPLEKPGLVDNLRIHWNSSTILYNVVRGIGRAAEFTVTATLNGTTTFSTNRIITEPGSAVEVIPIGSEADELFIELHRRASGIEFYGINEIEVDGPAISLPSARAVESGESELSPQYTILTAVDNDGSSAWVSGPEELVELEFPLTEGSKITEVALQWHCKTDPTYGRFGPAADMQMRVRNELTGQFEQIPFVRHVRLPDGWETSSFGVEGITNVITTDRVQIVLRAREATVDRYGLREARFRNKNRLVPVPIPSALNTLNFGASRPIVRAFDREYGTFWASGTQGGVGAISLSGSNLKFTNLRVKGFGTKAGRECFPMYLISPRGQRGGNVLVQDCVFSDPATNNTDGLTTVTMIQAPPDTLTNAVIRRCSVLGVNRDFTYSQGFTAIHVEDCIVDGAKIGAYFEPDSQTDDIGAVQIRTNQFLNVDHGVFVLFHPGRQFDSLTCIGNEIVLNGKINGTGIACCDTCTGGMSGSITNLTALNNIIRYPEWALLPTGRDMGLYYSDIHHAVLGNNLLVQGRNELRVRPYPAGTVVPPRPPEECDRYVVLPPGEPFTLPSVDDLRPGYRRAWFNNRNLTGELLPVRTSNFGADALATEQQWSD